MSGMIQDFSNQYVSALQRYLAHQEEAALEQAYELGRKALAEKIGLVEMVSVHQIALAEILKHPLTHAKKNFLIHAADEFLRECVGPFEMTLRGFQETMAKLQQVNEILEKRVMERTESLRRTGETLRALFQASPLAVIELDLNGCVLMWNPAAEQLFGWKQEEVLGLPNPIVPSGEQQEALFLRGRALQGESFAMLETIRQRKDGSLIPVSYSLAPLYDSEGKALGVMVVIADITERKQAEEALREAEERQRFALETSHTGAWDLNLVNHTAHRSLEHDRIFGYDQMLPQWTYQMFLDHVLPEDRAEVDAKFRHAVESQGDWSFECRIRRSDGEIRWIWAAGRYRSDLAGQEPRMAGIVQDITERKRAEEALRRAHDELEIRVQKRTQDLANSQARLQQLASQLLIAQEKERKRVAVELHDGLLSELAAMKFLFEGKLMLLEKGKLDDLSEFKRVSDILATVIKDARGIMNNLHPSVLDELGLIAAINWLSGEYEKSYPHIKVQKQIQASEWEISDGVKFVIFRVLQEALNNFAKHGKGDRVDLLLSKSNCSFALTIRDNGQGFDVEKAQKGVGLESMRERVEISGGEFQIESILGHGTTIRAIWSI